MTPLEALKNYRMIYPWANYIGLLFTGAGVLRGGNGCEWFIMEHPPPTMKCTTVTFDAGNTIRVDVEITYTGSIENSFFSATELEKQ